MAETTKIQGELHIQKPQPGQSSVLAVDPGTAVYLDFPLDQTEFVFQDGSLIFRFEDGEQVELQNFEEVLSSTSLFLPDGTEVSGDQIVETFQPNAGEPAAGAAPASGGAGEYDDYLGDGTDGIDRLGTLGPREFGGGFEEPNIEALELEEPGDTPTPEPPQAFDDFDELQGLTAFDERGDVTYRIFDDLEAQGNVLGNDVPEGVTVAGFSVGGTEYALGTEMTLPSGATFTLSENGTYVCQVDNTDTFTDTDTGINQGISIFGDIDPGYEVARLNFFTNSLYNDVDPNDGIVDDTINDDFIFIQYTDYAGNTSPGELVSDAQLWTTGGTWDLYDEDGIKSITIFGLMGEVTLDSIEIVDTDAPTPSSSDTDTINYTIVDANGLTSSANLTISYGDAPPPDPIPLPEIPV